VKQENPMLHKILALNLIGRKEGLNQTKFEALVTTFPFTA
jgi:hypothetical protein